MLIKIIENDDFAITLKECIKRDKETGSNSKLHESDKKLDIRNLLSVVSLGSL
jgi:hypothetical protein